MIWHSQKGPLREKYVLTKFKSFTVLCQKVIKVCTFKILRVTLPTCMHAENHCTALQLLKEKICVMGVVY